MIAATAFVHPQACVDATVEIGAGSRVWQFASVIRGARIGKGCNIANGACVDGSVIRDRCAIGHNLAMGPGFLIGSDCFIGPNVTFCNDAFPRTNKSGFEIARYQTQTEFAVIMESGASVGAGAVIMPGVRIGFGAMIAANSTVSKNVPPMTLHTRDGELRPLRPHSARMRFVETFGLRP